MNVKQQHTQQNLVFICLLLVVGVRVLISQTNVQNKPILSEVNEWFLSTGEHKNDPKLYVREFGEGQDTIVMLHGGWGAEHRGLLNAVQKLKNDFHFVFYDQRGSLRSPCADSLISFQNHINDVEQLRKELQIDKVTLVGHSMGAVLAGAYAKKYPDKISKLVLLAPAYLKEPFPDEDQPLKHQMYLKSKTFRERPEVKKELEKYNLTRDHPPLSSKEETMKFRINIAALMLYDITKWTELYSGGPFYNPKIYEITEKTYPKEGWDFYSEFQKRTYPISFIIGDHDWIDFQGMLTKFWMKDVPRIKLSMIKKAGHDLWIDQENEFVKELKHHLESK